MMIVRNVAPNDVDNLLALAKRAGIGLTTLPADKKALKKNIQRSIDSFAKELSEPSDEYYFFVLEDTTEKQVVGCCAIEAAVGGRKPFYSYKLSNVVQINKEFKIHKETQILQLVNDFQGATELCSLYLHPDYRKNHNGKMLSLSRFLFMAQFPGRFAELIFSELRGVSSETGHSLFWDAIGRHFFGLDFAEADYLTGIGKKQFIADLMPKYPVYVNMLAEDVQTVIGEPHPSSKAAGKILEQQAFTYRGYVDIFDAGPTIEASYQNIRAIRRTKTMPITKVKPHIDNQEKYLVCKAGLNFRLCLTHIIVNEEGVKIDEATARALQVKAGDNVCLLRMKKDF